MCNIAIMGLTSDSECRTIFIWILNSKYIRSRMSGGIAPNLSIHQACDFVF